MRSPSKSLCRGGEHCLGEVYRELYEMLARRQPLAEILARAAGILDGAFPGVRSVIHVLHQGRLHGYTASGSLDSWLRGMEGCEIEPGKLQAPWWQTRGRPVNIHFNPAWAGRTEGACCDFIWSWELATPAGEIVGTLTLLFPTEPHIDPQNPLLAEIRRFAPLAAEQEHLLEELTWQAHYDALTGLYNRDHFERSLEARLLDGTAGQAAVFWFSLERFARVNRILGYRVGDLVLGEAAARLRSRLQYRDTAARATGYEFVVAALGLASGDEARQRAEELREALSRPYELEGHTLTLGAGCGVGLWNDPREDVHTLLRRARAALTAAVASGSNHLAVFSPEMEDAGGTQRFEMEQRLRQALPRRELLLFYQPQIRLADESLCGVESLLRWHERDIGLVSAAVFIPLAEEVGLMEVFGEWVLAEACRQSRQWAARGVPVRIGVNVSASQFRSPSFADQVEATVAASGCDPRSLEIEITESQVLDSYGQALAHIRRLRSLGVRLALDDFGTGHSSLAYLRELPVDRVKIDRSFLAEIKPDSQPVLLNNIIRLSHDLGLEVIAEGAETAFQVSVLRRLGCDEVQGFYYGKPMAVSDFEAWHAEREAAVRTR